MTAATPLVWHECPGCEQRIAKTFASAEILRCGHCGWTKGRRKRRAAAAA